MSPGSPSPAGITSGVGSINYSLALALGAITCSDAWPGEGDLCTHGLLHLQPCKGLECSWAEGVTAERCWQGVINADVCVWGWESLVLRVLVAGGCCFGEGKVPPSLARLFPVRVAPGWSPSLAGAPGPAWYW